MSWLEKNGWQKGLKEAMLVSENLMKSLQNCSIHALYFVPVLVVLELLATSPFDIVHPGQLNLPFAALSLMPIMHHGRLRILFGQLPTVESGECLNIVIQNRLTTFSNMKDKRCFVCILPILVFMYLLMLHSSGTTTMAFLGHIEAVKEAANVNQQRVRSSIQMIVLGIMHRKLPLRRHTF